MYNNFGNKTITLTFAESGENHVGNEIIGEESDSGYSLNDLLQIESYFSNYTQTEIYDLRKINMENYDNLEEAYILVIKNPYPDLANSIFNTLTNGENNGGVNWDSKAFMRGEVKNKNARHNLLFSEMNDQNGNSIFKRDPDYENKMGTIYNFRYFPDLSNLYDVINSFPNGPLNVIEGNYYYDKSKTYIGFHGDAERKKVIGYRLGEDFPLYYKWFYRHNHQGETAYINLSHGDMYVMSSKAVGNDWKFSSKYTLRHAAGEFKVVPKLSTY